MIHARLECDAHACLCYFQASGHALQGRPGFDLVCAAFSTLARTAYASIERLEGLEISGNAAAEGELWFKVECPHFNAELKGITDFLVIGLQGLAQDFPQALKLELILR